MKDSIKNTAIGTLFLVLAPTSYTICNSINDGTLQNSTTTTDKVIVSIFEDSDGDFLERSRDTVIIEDSDVDLI